MSTKRASVDEEGEGHSMEKEQNQNSAGTNSEESVARNQDESIHA